MTGSLGADCATESGELLPFSRGDGENGLDSKGELSENLGTFLRSGMAGALFSRAGTGGGAFDI